MIKVEVRMEMEWILSFADLWGEMKLNIASSLEESLFYFDKGWSLVSDHTQEVARISTDSAVWCLFEEANCCWERFSRKDFSELQIANFKQF